MPPPVPANPSPSTFSYPTNNLDIFCELFPPFSSSHTANTQKCIEHVLSIEAARYAESPLGRVYYILSCLFAAELPSDLHLEEQDQIILSKLLSDIYSKLQLRDISPVLQMLERKMKKVIAQGPSSVPQKKNPFNMTGSALDILGPNSTLAIKK